MQPASMPRSRRPQLAAATDPDHRGGPASGELGEDSGQQAAATALMAVTGAVPSRMARDPGSGAARCGRETTGLPGAAARPATPQEAGVRTKSQGKGSLE